MLLAFLIHLIPTGIVLVALAVSWRWEWVGGILFIALGMAYLVTSWNKFHSVGRASAFPIGSRCVELIVPVAARVAGRGRRWSETRGSSISSWDSGSAPMPGPRALPGLTGSALTMVQTVKKERGEPLRIWTRRKKPKGVP